jgi:hypothetical protein
MTFLAPLFLGAAGAAALPLILHLMARRQTVRMPFSTIRFIKLAQKQSSTKIRMENFLLWLLRTLLMLLLAAAFAKPVYRAVGTHGFGSFLGASHRDVAIVWDASYSMGYETGSKNVWESSKETVQSIVRGLSRGDRVSIFLAADTVEPLIGEPTTDLDFALATIKGQTLRTTSSNLSDATVAAVESLKTSHQEREIYVVTDGQSLPWNGFRKSSLKTPASARTGSDSKTVNTAIAAWDPKMIDKKTSLFVTMLGARDPVNSAVVDTEVQPPVLMPDTAPQVRVRIAHAGPAQQTTAVLYLDDREIMRRSVDLGENTGYDLVFSAPSLPTGTHRARVEISDDGLAIDNIYYFLIKVREELPVVIAGTPDDTFFLERAIAPDSKGGLKPKRMTTEALGTESLDGYPCIFLCNALPMPGPVVGNIEEYVRHGGVLVIFPGDHASMADYAAWALLPAKIDKLIDGDGTEKRQGLLLLEPLDALFAGLKLPPGIVPSLTLHRRLGIASLERDAHVLIGASGDTPFLLSRRFGDGRVLMFTVSADRVWSDLPLSPFFLPLVQQAVRFAAGAGRDITQVLPSASFAISDVLGKIPEGAALIDPDQKVLPIRRVQRTGREGDIGFYVDNMTKPGYYFLSQGNKSAPEPVIAVNVDRAESDLHPIRPEEVPDALGVKNVSISTDQQELEHQIQEHRVGRPLTEVAFWVILVLSALEIFIANRASRKRLTLSETLSVHSSGRVLSKSVAASS